jgi:hypothetical protein
MAESRFEKMAADAFQTCANRIEEELVRLGKDRAIAAEFLERSVEFLRMPGLGLKIHARCGDLSTRGSSAESLKWFARQLAVHHPELGGPPVYIGNEQPPEPDHVIERRARVSQEMKHGAEFRQSIAEIQAGVEQDHAKRVAADLSDHRTHVRSML